MRATCPQNAIIIDFFNLILWSSSLRTVVILSDLLITFFSNNFNVFLPQDEILGVSKAVEKIKILWTELNWMTHVTVTLADTIFRTCCTEQLWPLTDTTIKQSVLIGAFEKLEKRILASSRPSVYPSTWNNTAPTGRIFVKSYTRVFFENLSRIFKFHWNMIRITITLHEDLYTFKISQSFSEWESCQIKFVQKIKTSVLCSIISFFENRTVCEMDQNAIQPDRPHTHTHTHTNTIFNT